MHVLDNPVWHALAGPHAHLALGAGGARRYPADVAPFFAVAAPAADAYRDLAALPGPGEDARLFRPLGEPAPAGWDIRFEKPILQMVCAGPPHAARRAIPLARLGAGDAAEMLALAERTKPGPFAARTFALGNYIGVRDGGRLVAMAGERFRLPGFTEISAICALAECRGRGYARALIVALTADIFARGEQPFLHVFPDNTGARRLYEALGFTLRARLLVRGLVPPPG